jgi:hypothetical protein
MIMAFLDKEVVKNICDLATLTGSFRQTIEELGLFNMYNGETGEENYVTPAAFTVREGKPLIALNFKILEKGFEEMLEILLAEGKSQEEVDALIASTLGGCLVHEVTHYYQWRNGDLVVNEGERWIQWKGKTFHVEVNDMDDYLTRPWEQEALRAEYQWLRTYSPFSKINPPKKGFEEGFKRFIDARR